MRVLMRQLRQMRCALAYGYCVRCRTDALCDRAHMLFELAYVSRAEYSCDAADSPLGR